MGGVPQALVVCLPPGEVAVWEEDISSSLEACPAGLLAR